MYIITVPHQFPPKMYKGDSLYDIACNVFDLTIEAFNDIHDVEDAFCVKEDELPDDVKHDIKAIGFPCIHVYNSNGCINYFSSVNNTSIQADAVMDYLKQEFYSIIQINTKEDALYYANEYNGHQKFKVRELAEYILRSEFIG